MKSDAVEKEIYDSQAERRSKQRYRRRVTIGQVALIVLVLAAWQFGSGRLFDPFFVGNPAGVAKILIDDLGDPRFWNDLRVTGTEMTLGYLLGGLSGTLLAYCSRAGGSQPTYSIPSSLGSTACRASRLRPCW
jgi:ABC-type nitrate/sulfonate/bicarbonate transport system permease component